MPGRKYASLGRPDIYESLRRDHPGMSKASAAAISNAKATPADWKLPPSKRGKKPPLFKAN